MSTSPTRMLPAGDLGAAPRVAEQREADGRLARAGLAHEPEHLAGRDRERDLVDDVDLGVAQDDAQALDRDGRRGGAHSARPRSMPMAARAMPSPTRLVPIVSSAIATTGSTTPHGCDDERELVLVDHRAPVGAVRVGREAEERESPRSGRSSRSGAGSPRPSAGERMLGRISPNRMRGLETPSASAEATKSRSTIGWAAPRVTRATRGMRRQSDGEHDQPVLRPERRDRDQRQHDLREGQDDVHGAHQDVVERVARVGGDEPDDRPRGRDRGAWRARPRRGAARRPRGTGSRRPARGGRCRRAGRSAACWAGRRTRSGRAARRKRPKTAIATRMPTRISPMRVRHSPSALRSSRPVGRCAAGLSGMTAMLVSAMALTGASSAAA